LNRGTTREVAGAIVLSSEHKMRAQPATHPTLTEKQREAVARAYCYLLHLAHKGENTPLPEFLADPEEELNKLAEFETCGIVDETNPTPARTEVGQR
jgi:hypothetical protein